ncbi:His-Xaa-Ser system radical SAM maturase HxsC [Buttiauxella sp.]|uniref:His-Xaa-Ser system radical SAM maturase HxsC n=1 Tax=Buttiauxella sp. TaxID=1972222 RepID=UPI003C71A9A1
MNSETSTKDDLFLFCQAVETIRLTRPLLGKVVTEEKGLLENDLFFLSMEHKLNDIGQLACQAVICSQTHPQRYLLESDLNCSVILVTENTIFTSGDVITVSVKGRIHRNYRVASGNNAFLVTESCNNLCIMCPQPPKPQKINVDNQCEGRINQVLNLIGKEHIPATLCITGGEPTMLKQGLVNIVEDITRQMPDTLVHLLTNGRSFCYEKNVADISSAAKGNMLAGIPLFAHVSDIHDYIVQSHGAFDQTMAGLLNCYKYGIAVELRVVLHRQTIPHLVELAEFISRNLFFVKHVALMGMENMGFAKMNRKELHIDPWEYKDTLSKAVKLLDLYGIETRIFNLPLCVVNSDAHQHCVQSISDFKNIYHPECSSCSKQAICCGFFSSSTEKFPLTHHIVAFH